MKHIYILLILFSCMNSNETRDLKKENKQLKDSLKLFQINKILNDVKSDSYRIKAIRIIDSLKFKDPKTLEQLKEEIIYSDDNTVEY